VRNVGIKIVKNLESASFEPHQSVANVDLQPITVMLQLMRPAWPGWRAAWRRLADTDGWRQQARLVACRAR